MRKVDAEMEMPRLHVKAVPGLSIFEVRKQVEAGRSIVIWHDGNDTLIGKANVNIKENILQLHWSFRNAGLIFAKSDANHFALQPASDQSLSGDNHTLCPSCGLARSWLYFHIDEWLCRRCHGLHYRSTMISQSVRTSDRLLYLDKLVGRGRPKGMHARTYHQLRRERSEKRHFLGTDIVNPWAQYAKAIDTRWLEQPPPLAEMGKVRMLVADTVQSRRSLLLAGERLFSGEALLDRLRDCLQREAAKRYEQLSATRRRVSGLQVRRAMTTIDLPHAVTIEPGAVITVAGRLDDGRIYAEHHSKFVGSGSLFGAGVDSKLPGSLPVGTVVGDTLIIGVVYDEDDAPFVPAFIQSRIEDVQLLLREQHIVLTGFRRRLADHVREAVAALLAPLQRPKRSRLDQLQATP